MKREPTDFGHLVLFFSLMLLAPTVVSARALPPILSTNAIHQPVLSTKGMVASQERFATQAGVEILKEGGNAIDAAVTVALVEAVTHPQAGNIGGGGFMMVSLAPTAKLTKRQVIALDYREKAPIAAHQNMFLAIKGKEAKIIPGLSTYSHLAVGVPGTVAGLSHALKKWGTISWKKALAPAIQLAKKGFVVDDDLAYTLFLAKEWLTKNPETARIFYKVKKDANGKTTYGDYLPGEVLVQKDLAQTLELLALNGPEAFYQGSIAEKLVADMKRYQGIMTRQDLEIYKAVEREPVRGEYKGHEIFSMPPPSSGGVHLVQLLNMLSHFPLADWGHNSAKTIHAMVEAMKLAYADRSQYLGDPDFVEIPLRGLVSKNYADELVKKIDLKKATPSTSIKPGNPMPYESDQTTHFSVMDQFGNAVSNTYTLNFSFGTGIVAAGTGILLNNEMDDFSVLPGAPNAYGLIGGEANAIAPQKRMLSSMTPTIVHKDGEPFLVTGSPGGSRIISTTLQIILNVLEHKLNLAEANHAVRIHHQWFPDEIRIEEGLNRDTQALLKELGHSKLSLQETMGSVQSIMKIGPIFYGSTDPRSSGGLALGFGVPQFH
jgi:gamma-glutamyltranspeptidase/glutathione hydrolase